MGLSAAPVFHLDCLFLLTLVLCTVRKQHWPGGPSWVVDPGHSLDSQQLEARWKEGESDAANGLSGTTWAVCAAHHQVRLLLRLRSHSPQSFYTEQLVA